MKVQIKEDTKSKIIQAQRKREKRRDQVDGEGKGVWKRSKGEG